MDRSGPIFPVEDDDMDDNPLAFERERRAMEHDEERAEEEAEWQSNNFQSDEPAWPR